MEIIYSNAELNEAIDHTFNLLGDTMSGGDTSKLLSDHLKKLCLIRELRAGQIVSTEAKD